MGFCSAIDAAVVDASGTVEPAAFAAAAASFSSCCRRAFSIISSCLLGSLARMGTRSLGTGVPSLKFLENFISSLSLIVRS